MIKLRHRLHLQRVASEEESNATGGGDGSVYSTALQNHLVKASSMQGMDESKSSASLLEHAGNALEAPHAETATAGIGDGATTEGSPDSREVQIRLYD